MSALENALHILNRTAANSSRRVQRGLRNRRAAEVRSVVSKPSVKLELTLARRSSASLGLPCARDNNARLMAVCNSLAREPCTRAKLIDRLNEASDLANAVDSPRR